MKTKYFYLALVVLLLTGCSTISVTKVPIDNSGNVKGVRYSLGKPFIQVTPAATGDGSYSVEVVYLPDEDQTYAVSSSTFLAKNTMEVSVDENGILKKIDWTGATDGNASEALKSAAEIEKGEYERKKKLNDEAEAAAKAKKKAAEDAVKLLKDSVTKKKIELDNLKADLQSLVDTYPKPSDEIKEKIRQEKVAILKLEAEIKVLETQLGEANANLTSASEAFNDAGASKENTAWGPVLFSIVESKDKEGVRSVKLEAVKWVDDKKQLQFKTATKVETTETTDAKVPKLTQTGELTARFDEHGEAEIKLTFDTAIIDVVKSQSKFDMIEPVPQENENPNFNKVNISVNANKEVTIKFKKQDFKAAKYALDLHFTYKKNNVETENSSTITIILN